MSQPAIIALIRATHRTAVIGLALVTVCLANAQPPDAPETAQCGRAGDWIGPAVGKSRGPQELFASLSQYPVVLLGETHDRPAHHRWQLHTLAALYAHNPRMVIGFEMFPRSVQPALDRWVGGELSESEFLAATRWHAVWGFGADLYLPLFHFARQNRIPMIALNVERALISRIAEHGWTQVPETEREGVDRPAPISDDYRRRLAQVFLVKAQKHDDAHGVAEREWSDAEIEATVDRPEFQWFTEAQSTWDRAMAEALADGLRRTGAHLAVGIMGRGHVEFGHGVAHQLRDLDVHPVATLLPFEITVPCETLPPNIADAVFLLDNAKPDTKPRPLLGVMIEAAEHGVRVTRVTEGSVAQQAGILSNDVIVNAAGASIESPSQLVAMIARVAFGTWLPITVKREESVIEIVAKFPPTEEIDP
ncbi:MAG: ChaN family lipoprotein [Gammaproteobacteria bacterium]|nr:ChaN family lipoprotein [Gammaproteobacteria bacterium]